MEEQVTLENKPLYISVSIYRGSLPVVVTGTIEANTLKREDKPSNESKEMSKKIQKDNKKKNDLGVEKVPVR